MSFKLKIGQLIDYLIDRLIRLNIKSVLFIPNGRFLTLDLKRAGIKLETIFDVGANIGQTAIMFNKHFPQAVIYSFEPVLSVYDELVRNTANPHIICINKALGSEATTSKIYKSDTYSGIATINGENNDYLSEVEDIIVDTGANICEAYHIAYIDMLKIDTEGYELAVLAGLEPMLTKVKFIYVEVGFDPDDNCKTQLSDILTLLTPYHFVVSGFYSPYRMGLGKLRLNHCDVLLTNSKLVEI